MVQSVDRAMVILDHLKESPNGLGVTEIARKLEVAKSTVHRLLATLEKHRYVKRVNSNGIYQLGLKFIEMNHSVIENLNIVELAHPVIKELTEEISEITHLGMIDGFEFIYIDKVESNSTIRIYSQTGRRAPIYCTGIGKAIAAFFPEHKLQQYLSVTDLKAYTEHTITSKDQFIKEMEQVRKVGYVFDNEEHEEGIRCVAAPVFNHHGEVVYAISATGPLTRMDDRRIEKILPLLKEAGSEISRRIGY